MIKTAVSSNRGVDANNRGIISCLTECVETAWMSCPAFILYLTLTCITAAFQYKIDFS
jgi:hypothetical protein